MDMIPSEIDTRLYGGPILQLASHRLVDRVPLQTITQDKHYVKLQQMILGQSPLRGFGCINNGEGEFPIFGWPLFTFGLRNKNLSHAAEESDTEFLELFLAGGAEPFLPNTGKDFFQDIPKEMATDVFLRLPAKSVITCKGVCKSWSDLIRSSKFAAVHEQKLHARSCTILEFVEEALDGSDRHPLNTILTLRLFIAQKRYVVTYNPSKGRIYALFRYQAKSDDILKATFHGSYQVAKWNGLKFP
ncbi:hypothetical protein OROMI_021077 [Orobanche minor]